MIVVIMLCMLSLYVNALNRFRAAKLSLLNFLSLFRDLQKPTRFGGGGGVVAEFFRDPQKPTRFSGGGGSSRNFPLRNQIFTPHSVIFAIIRG